MKYARCTREEFAGDLSLDEKTTPAAYVHKLTGECDCGTTHGNQPPPAKPVSKQSQNEIDWEKPTHIFDCRRTDGSLVVQKARWDHDCHGQKLGSKLLLWRPPGRIRWGKAEGIQADEFFQLDLLLKEKSRNGKVTAYITESEMNALVLAERENVIAISTFHGSNFIPRGFTPETTERMLEPLRGVHVVAIVDRDDAGKKWMGHVRELIAPLVASLKFVHSKTTGDGDDVVDHLDAGHGLDDLLPAAGPAENLTLHVQEQPKSRVEKKEASQAQRVLKIVSAPGVELFHDTEPKPYITFVTDEHYETHTTTSRSVRRWLSFEHYKTHGLAPNPEAIRSAILTMEGQALFGGISHDVHIRVASDRGAILLDLGDPRWRVVRIDAAGWSVLEKSPVRFRRAPGMARLPFPERGGDLADLRRFVNVASEEDFALLVGWLVGALRSSGPYLVLILQGEQGSAKSTTSRVLRRLLDPNKSALRARPREPRDLAIAANNAWCIALDNLSGLPDWLSDALCRLATGGGFATRALYTDDEESIFDAQRPILLNGIDDVANRGDLLDRAIVLTLPRLDQIRDEKSFWSEFDETLPRLFGSLLDALSMALRRERETEVALSVRMMDAARWITAAEPALPWPDGTFLRAYAENREDADRQAIEASVVASEILRFMRGREQWNGSFGELLVELQSSAPDGVRGLKAWPKTPRKLSGELRRSAPNLRAIGVELEFPGKRGRGNERRASVLIHNKGNPQTPQAPQAPQAPLQKSEAFSGPYRDDSGADGADREDGNANRPHIGPTVSARYSSDGADGAGGAGDVHISESPSESRPVEDFEL